uniref:Uncharacterized protein n=1 Tax=Vespula pensylvanica TaxID=30213 RepID=A0A834JLK4_VESPE|nr:hypothetical protein H0235_017591 [Vespula pensylvanica]
MNKRLARERDCLQRLDCLEDSFGAYEVYMRLFSAYLCITSSKIVERMTSTGDIFPQIVTLEDPPHFRDKAWFKKLRQSTQRKDLVINVEEEEEERGDTEDEELQGEAKDYKSIIVYDSFNDRYYLDDDHSTNKFNSNQNYIGLCPVIDFANLDLNSKIFNRVYRKNEVEWIIENYRE